MKRTTIFAEEDVLLELKHLAKTQDRTLTDVIREALHQYLKDRRPEPRRFPFIGMAAFEPNDVASRSEEILANDIKRESGWG